MVGRPLRKVPCGARRKYDGQPCQAKALGNGRCYLHGGLSTGQKTIESKVKALRNLKPFRGWSDEEIKRYYQARHPYQFNERDTFNKSLFVTRLPSDYDSVSMDDEG